MGMAESKFFSNSQTHGKIIVFKISKHETPVTTQDNNAQLNYLMVKKLEIPDANVYFEKKAEFGGFSNELKNGKIELESQNQRIVARE